MIILDLNQIIISNIMAQVGTHTNVPIEEGLVRHMVLNQIRYIRNKFKSEYGDQLVITTDGRYYWRKDIFPYYKANRATARKASDFDWQTLFDVLGKVRSELIEYMPYPVLYHEKAEADDMIAVITKMASRGGHKAMIVSGDTDFAQLQIFPNVAQFDPIRGKFIKVDDPSKYLREHIIRGDSGDGVPNILSADDCLVNKVRQKKITQKVLDQWITVDPSTATDEKYIRNRNLIDLSYVPEWLADEAMKMFREQVETKNRSKMFNYFAQYKLKLLMEHLQEF